MFIYLLNIFFLWSKEPLRIRCPGTNGDFVPPLRSGVKTTAKKLNIDNIRVNVLGLGYISLSGNSDKIQKQNTFSDVSVLLYHMIQSVKAFYTSVCTSTPSKVKCHVSLRLACGLIGLCLGRNWVFGQMHLSLTR